MRDLSPIRTARRRVRRIERERLGLATTPCVMCIEEHHTAGKNHDSQLTAPLCKLHHREIHEQIARAGVSLRYEPNPVSRVAKALRASAIYDRAHADAKDRWADLLDQSGGRSR